MQEIQLDVQIRNELGTRKIKKVRREDFFPGIVYGEGKKPTPIKVDRRAYERIVRHHRGESVLFHINIFEGDKKLKDYSAIIKEEQHHPVLEHVLHIDFNHISLTKQITVKVPIVHKGDPVGVKRDGGSLEQILWELDIMCLPKNIPQNISIDVSALKIGDSIFVKDIVLPAEVKTKHDLEGIVFTVVPPMKEEEIKPEEAPAELEVIKEKKDKEEGKEKKSEEAPLKAEEKKEKAKE